MLISGNISFLKREIFFWTLRKTIKVKCCLQRFLPADTSLRVEEILADNWLLYLGGDKHYWS